MSKQIKADYDMNVQEPWFSEIGNPNIHQRKTVEGRVGNEQKHNYLIGKIVRIVTDNKYLFVKVKTVKHYDTLVDYLRAEGWKNVAPQASSYMDALEKYSQVTTLDKEGKITKVFADKRIEEEGGINALHLELLSPIYNINNKNQTKGTSVRSTPSPFPTPTPVSTSPKQVSFSNKLSRK